MDEMLKEALGNDYVEPAPDEIYTSSIPPEFKKVVKHGLLVTCLIVNFIQY